MKTYRVSLTNSGEVQLCNVTEPLSKMITVTKRQFLHTVEVSASSEEEAKERAKKIFNLSKISCD